MAPVFFLCRQPAHLHTLHYTLSLSLSLLLLLLLFSATVLLRLLFSFFFLRIALEKKYREWVSASGNPCVHLGAPIFAPFTPLNSHRRELHTGATENLIRPISFPDKVMEINMKWRKKKKEKKKAKAQKQLAQLRIRKQTTVDRVQNDMIHMLEKHSSRMSYSYLLNATNCFSDDNVIGLGKLATLYKAAIGNGNFLTVKRFRDFPHIEQKFMCKIMTNGRLRHKNLVSLLGFCKEKQEKLLVYSYMANGSLYDWLHPMEVGYKRPTLNWPLRYVITVGIARGLAWLHHNYNYRVTHGNICSKFVFLDKQFNPKISSFGGTRIVGSNSGNVRMRICEKSEFRESDDVYAFGILLVEVITGETPEDVSNLCEGFDGTLIGGNLRNAIDSSLSGKGFDSEIAQVLQVALDCVGLSSNGRPTMLEVYRCLSSIGAKKESAYTFGTSNQIGDGFGTHMAEHSVFVVFGAVCYCGRIFWRLIRSRLNPEIGREVRGVSIGS